MIHDLVTLGETMGLFRSVELGSLATVSDFRLGVGGAESNVAIGVSRLGLDAAWVGRVGNDGLGQRVVRELRAEGLDVHAVVDSSARTAVMIKEARLPSATRVHYYRTESAGSRLEAADLEDVDIESARLLHVTGITLALSATARAAVLVAVRRAKSAGVPVSFDVNHRTSLWGMRSPTDLYREVAAQATVVFAGEEEVRYLVGDASEPARAIAALGVAEVIVKRGAAGCDASIDGVDFHRNAWQVDVVDTVGAGDAFVAGYLAERLLERNPDDRLETAVRAGAFACQTAGDWEGFPRRDELALLENSEPVAR